MKKIKIKFSYVYPIYTIITLGSMFFTNLTFADTLFWASLLSLLISFFTSSQSRLSLTKVFRFADFRFKGVDSHTKEILDPNYNGIIKKENDNFYGDVSFSSFLFGIITLFVSAIFSII